MDGLLRDIQQSLRSLGRSRSFTLATVAVLALGIGVSTAIFSVVEHILFRPLPVAGAARLVTLCETHGAAPRYCSVSPPDAEDWAARSRMLADIGVARASAMSLRAGGRTTLLTAGIATPGFLRAVGMKPLMGRLIQSGDLPPAGAGRVAVLTYGLWQTALGGDPGAVGRTIHLDGAAYTVVGVLPEGAYVPRLDYARLWAPLPFDPRAEANRVWRGFVAAARLKPGATPARAQAELTAIDAGLAAAHPDAMKGWGVRVQGMRAYLTRNVRATLLVFLAAAGLVLLIVCVNVAGLLLVRATSRERDLSIRLALGAGTGAIARRLLTESLLLGLMGGGAGVLLAVWATAGFVHLAPAGIPRIGEVRLDATALGFALLAALLAGLVAGLAPVLRGRRLDVAGALREGRGQSADRRTGRARRSLVTGQLALALMLVVAAALLLRSFAGLLDWRPGFDPQHLLTFQVFPSTGRYPKAPQVLALYRQAEQELRRLPGVRSVSTMSAGPIFGGDGTTPVLVQGRGGSIGDAPTTTWFDVGPDYFRTLGLPMLQGRAFTEADDAGGAPVAIINQTMARRLWPGRNPLDAGLLLPRLDSLRVKVVGVVADTRPFYPGQPTTARLYLPNRQYTRWATFFLVRTTGDPMRLAGPAKAALLGLDPDLEPVHVRSMTQIADALRGEPRFQLTLIALFALVALVLGAVGVYGVTAFVVRSRAHEIGLRIALGGTPRQVMGWVLIGGFRLLAVGLGLGLVGALAASRLLSGLLYGVRPTDPIAITAAALVLLAAGLAAAIIPALRASHTDPADALRRE